MTMIETTTKHNDKASEARVALEKSDPIFLRSVNWGSPGQHPWNMEQPAVVNYVLLSISYVLVVSVVGVVVPCLVLAVVVVVLLLWFLTFVVGVIPVECMGLSFIVAALVLPFVFLHGYLWHTVGGPCSFPEVNKMCVEAHLESALQNPHIEHAWSLFVIACTQNSVSAQTFWKPVKLRATTMAATATTTNIKQ